MSSIEDMMDNAFKPPKKETSTEIKFFLIAIGEMLGLGILVYAILGLFLVIISWNTSRYFYTNIIAIWVLIVAFLIWGIRITAQMSLRSTLLLTAAYRPESSSSVVNTQKTTKVIMNELNTSFKTLGYELTAIFLSAGWLGFSYLLAYLLQYPFYYK